MYQTPRNYYTPQVGLKGRPVSSIEEARATGIDFDGSMLYGELFYALHMILT